MHHNRGAVLVGLERYREAMESYDRALELDPGYIPARANRMMVALNLCDWERVARTPVSEVAAVARPLTFLGYSDDKTLQLQCAMGATRTLVPAPLAPLWQGEKYRHDRIRLAYVSSDIREHGWLQLASLIERHDRARFQVIGTPAASDDRNSPGW